MVWKQGWGTDRHEALFSQAKSYVKRVPPQNATGWGPSVQTDESGGGGGGNNLNSQVSHPPSHFFFPWDDPVISSMTKFLTANGVGII